MFHGKNGFFGFPDLCRVDSLFKSLIRELLRVQAFSGLFHAGRYAVRRGLGHWNKEGRIIQIRQIRGFKVPLDVSLDLKILALLVKYFDADKSKILKEAMWDKFEDLRDREIIEDFEKKNKVGKVQFGNADDLIKKIGKKKKSA